MKTIALAFASSAITLAALSYSSPAHALGPVDIEFGARAGYATNPKLDFGANPFGFGIGGRAGVAIFGIYGGISGMYYLGSSVSGSAVAGAPGGSGYSAHTAMEGFELGYTLPIPIVKIRPLVGLGNATISVDPFSYSNLYVEPGVLVMIPVSIVYFGADVNALLLPGMSGVGETTSSKTYASLSVHGQFGFRF